MSARPVAIELHPTATTMPARPRRGMGSTHDRPLSPKSERQSDRLGRFLAAAAIEPSAIISSPKLRARQTADIVGGHLGVPVSLDERLGDSLDFGRHRGDPRRCP